MEVGAGGAIWRLMDCLSDDVGDKFLWIQDLRNNKTSRW